MPNYDYICEECKYEFEAFHAMSAEPLLECPRCNLPKLIKLIGIGSSPIIKGTDNPCQGGRKSKTRKPNIGDKLGEGKNKAKMPWWRDGAINKKMIAKNPEKYIKEGKVD